MEPLKVLSIDWDYLIDATLQQRILWFPENGNEDIPVGLQDLLWAMRYGEQEGLSQIKVDKKAMSLVKQFISKTCNRDTFVTVYDSHKWCFDEVITRVEDNQSLEVINIDFHHDMYGSIDFLDEIDCGNWVNCLFEKDAYRFNQKSDKYYWVSREDSDEYPYSSEYLHNLSIEDLVNFVDFKFDLLFICRSSCWTPPHLDDKFIKFYNWVNDNISKVELNITGSRYTKEFKKEVKAHGAFVENIKSI